MTPSQHLTPTHLNPSPSSPRIFAFSGKSNSGKTTLICKLCTYFNEVYKLNVAIIKHDPKDKAMFDSKGKDSYEFFHTSGAIALISPTRTTLQIKHQSTEQEAFERVLQNFQHYDYVFIEGLKTLPYPRIVLARGCIESGYIPYAQAFAIDKSVCNAEILPSTLPVLNLNDTKQIADFIYTYFD